MGFIDFQINTWRYRILPKILLILPIGNWPGSIKYFIQFLIHEITNVSCDLKISWISIVQKHFKSSQLWCPDPHYLVSSQCLVNSSPWKLSRLNFREALLVDVLLTIGISTLIFYPGTFIHKTLHFVLFWKVVLFPDGVTMHALQMTEMVTNCQLKTTLRKGEIWTRLE